MTIAQATNTSRPTLVRFLIIALLALPMMNARVVADTVQAINATVSSYLETHPGQSVSLIVQTRGASAPVMSDVRASGGTVSSTYSAINGFTAVVAWEEGERLNHDARVQRVNLNAPIRLLGSAVNSGNLANRYEPISQIPAAWNQGLDGSEVKVAVIDSGVYPHDDLTQVSGAVPAGTGNRLLGLYTNPNATNAGDQYGHGTHVAGIVAGNGYDSNGRRLGVAPNSLLVSVKVTDDSGNANEGDVISGLDWVYQANQHGMGIRIANLSLSSTVAQSYNASALDAMAEKLWASGVTVVVSSGVGSGSVLYAPGNDPYVITVGSVEDSYQTNNSQLTMASWSPYGTSQDGFAKPDVVADGSHVVSLLAPNSLLSQQHPGNIVGEKCLLVLCSAGRYFKMGGTSMAAPQIAGLAALMLQQNPGLTNNQIKGLLVKHSIGFGTVAYTSALGTPGGLVSSAAVGQSDANANGGNTYSQAYDPTQNAILAGGSWFADASWPNASWNSTAWNSTAWNSTAWNSTAWNSTAWNSTAWNSTAWNSTAWNSTAWNSTAWNSTAWNSTAWNSTSWNDASFA